MLKKSMGYLVASSLIAAALTFASPAIAHHSSAMFDLKKSITFTGVVQEWQFTNPHTYLMVMAGKPGAPDQKVLWTLESGAVNGLVRQGFGLTTFKPGEQISVTVHPMRNGSAAGQLISAIGADKVVHKFIYF
jgi:hypothetical protein